MSVPEARERARRIRDALVGDTMSMTPRVRQALLDCDALADENERLQTQSANHMEHRIENMWGEQEWKQEAERVVAEAETLRQALERIAEHLVVSEGEFPDDNCDWHCTAEIVDQARAALAASSRDAAP